MKQCAECYGQFSLPRIMPYYTSEFGQVWLCGRCEPVYHDRVREPVVEMVVANEVDKKFLFDTLVEMPLPFTAKITKGKHRSLAQNRLQRLWMGQAAAQWPDYDAEGHRAYCKAYFGIPILVEDADFKEKYDRIIRPLPIEQKLELMAVPFDFPVTRIMTTEQKKRYLDRVYIHFTEHGVKLTEPDPAW